MLNYLTGAVALPKVSVITAAYNHVQFVRQSVESVQAQTYRDFEHIVIDDGSTDGTSEILKSFGDQITYIRQENRGAHAAINEGIRRSAGECIAIIDSDDAWLPNKLERQMQTFESFPQAAMVYSLAYQIDEDGSLLNGGRPIGAAFQDPAFAFEQLLEANRIPVLTVVIKKSCLEEIGFFSERLKAVSDWDLWVRISAKWPVGFTPEALALYRFHQNNASHKLLEHGTRFREHLQLLRNASAAVSGSGIDNMRRQYRVRIAFGNVILHSIYRYCYEHKYLKALGYFLFALRLRPSIIQDGILAIRLHPTFIKQKQFLRIVPRLFLGKRGLAAIREARQWFS